MNKPRIRKLDKDTTIKVVGRSLTQPDVDKKAKSPKVSKSPTKVDNDKNSKVIKSPDIPTAPEMENNYSTKGTKLEKTKLSFTLDESDSLKEFSDNGRILQYDRDKGRLFYGHWTPRHDDERYGEVLGDKYEKKVKKKFMSNLMNSDMEYYYTQWNNVTRIFFEYILAIILVGLIVSFYFHCWIIIDLRRFTIPYPFIFEYKDQTISFNYVHLQWIYTYTGILFGTVIVRFIFLILVIQTENQNLEKSPHYFGAQLVAYFALFSFILTFVTLAISIRDFRKYNDELSVPLMSGIDRYKTFKHIKHQFDELQVDLECCGTFSPKDWFKIDLTELQDDRKYEVDPLYVDFISDMYHCTTGTKGGNSMQVVNKYKSLHSTKMGKIKSVPYSCCNISVIGDCVFYDIENSLKFYASSMKPMETINQVGCVDRLLTHFINVYHQIRLVYAIIAAVEIIFYFLAAMVYSSYFSCYRLQQQPTNVQIPYCTVLIPSLALAIYSAFFMKLPNTIQGMKKNVTKGNSVQKI